MASLPRLADELVEVRALRPVAEARLAFSFGLVGRARHMQGVVVSPKSVTWLPCGSIRSSRTEHSFKSIEQSRGSSVRAGGFRGWLGVTKVHRDQDMDQTPGDQLGGIPSWACRRGWPSQPKLPIPSPSTRAGRPCGIISFRWSLPESWALFDVVLHRSRRTQIRRKGSMDLSEGRQAFREVRQSAKPQSAIFPAGQRRGHKGLCL
mmetsp:Transcript_110099/g.355049  ORF Transcript_110099/g.355049 Transcript_110099/m.355049 type:complete len:206 (-) Transcript_110099:88-705(-)